MVEAAPADETLSQRVKELGVEIRELKARLGEAGLSKSAINQHEEVVRKVAALQGLKSQLDEDDPCTDQAFFAQKRLAQQEARREEQREIQAQREELRKAEQQAPKPLTQRKIFHAFRFTGSGATFHYEPPARLNSSQTGFGEGSEPCPSVYITEKWDGTTMQATRTHIFKRLDLWGKRRNEDPSRRYDLRLIAWRGEETGWSWRGLDFREADVRFAPALERHLPAFASLEQGLCVYFEVVHTDINTTFKHLPGFADIRVFDFSRAESFIPFQETIRLCEQFGLPIVGWERQEALSAVNLWAQLEAARSRQYSSAAAPLEGFVLREASGGERIAKLRVENFPSEANGGEPRAGGTPTPGAPLRALHRPPHDHLTTTAVSLHRAHLEEIGLNLVRPSCDP